MTTQPMLTDLNIYSLLQPDDIYRVWLQITQHLKCDHSTTPENFCAKFCMLVYQSSVH